MKYEVIIEETARFRYIVEAESEEAADEAAEEAHVQNPDPNKNYVETPDRFAYSIEPAGEGVALTNCIDE